MPRLIAAPWLARTATDPSSRPPAIRSNAAAARSATAVTGSPSDGIQAAYSSGYRSWISVLVRPSQEPPPRSRRSLSSWTGSPVSRARYSAVSVARARSEEKIAPGRRAAM